MDRLNGVVSVSGSKAPPWEKKTAGPAPSASRQATPADRKKQLEQLAELGVAVPEDFRKEMAMAGDWQTTSQRIIYDTVKKEGDMEDVKPGGLNIGVRKRKFEGQEEEEEAAGEAVVRRGWGSAIRTYPGIGRDGDDDLDDLLKTTNIVKSSGGNVQQAVPTDESAGLEQGIELSGYKRVGYSPSDPPKVKREESSGDAAITETVPEQDTVKDVSVKREEPAAAAGLIFKKRKAKPIRQK